MEYRPRRGPLRAYGTPALAAATLLAAWLAVSRAFSVGCSGRAPCVTLRALLDGAPLPEALHIHDRHGELLADVGAPRRRALPVERIPARLAAAFVAVEDRRFRDHDGVDVRGVGRAALRNAIAGEIEEGASTIPMQLVRTLWAEDLRGVGPWRRKIIEARTAPRLVEELGHDRVLAHYLNAIYLGDGVYGVEEAARHYFGVTASELDLGQIATLVGMTPAPERYHPRRHPERARVRRDVVLGVLARAGVARLEETETMRRRPLGTVPEPPPPPGRSYVSAAVTRELRRAVPELAGDPGLRIVTTLDGPLQEAAEEAVSRQLRAIERGAYGRFRAPTDTADVVQAAAVALDPATGQLRAWVGGRDFRRSEFDRVEQAERQVGSLVKPFLVALALERGRSILDLVSADTVAFRVRTGVWSPADHVTDPILPMREALVHSSNRAAVQFGRSLGMDAARVVGRRVGIDGKIPALPSAFIGAFEASLLEMTRAYATFGNGGLLVDPYVIERIEDARGDTLWVRPPTSPEPVLDPVTSFVILDALRDVVDRGTGRAVRAAGYAAPAAGKTGTTDAGRDAWFVGLTPRLAAGVWIGFDAPRSVVPGAGGGALAAPLWATWMASALAAGEPAGRGRAADREAAGVEALHGDGWEGEARTAPREIHGWHPPPGVERVRYDVLSGEAREPDCSSGPERLRASAWIPEGSVEIRGCPGPIQRWLNEIWRIFSPAGSEADTSSAGPNGGETGR